MLIRIVKMKFRDECVSDFLNNFEANKERIRGFNGCKKLELYRDKNSSDTFFTYSFWDSEENLNTYRQSDFFNKVWSVTRTYFSEKPEAWSVDLIEQL